jgi:hypothetical protein
MEELTAPEAPAATPSPAPADTPAPTEAKAPESVENKFEAAEKALDDDLRRTYRNANKPRAENGKFASTDGEKAAAEADKPADAEAKPAEATPAEQLKAPAIPPPHSWSKEAAAEWGKIPPALQAHIAQREAQSHKQISELGQYAKAFEPIREALAPHADRLGNDPKGYIERVLAADLWLARDPVNAIKALADSYRVDLASIADPFALPADPQSQQLNAQLNAAWQEIDNLKRQLGDTRQRVEGREAQEYQARQSSYEREVDAFVSDKPDFNDLASDIETYIPLIKRSNPTLSTKDILQEAYDRARWANPATRQRLIAEQTARQEQARLETAKKAAADAKRAAAINVNGSVVQRGQPSLDDDLRSIWRRAHAS